MRIQIQNRLSHGIRIGDDIAGKWRARARLIAWIHQHALGRIENASWSAVQTLRKITRALQVRGHHAFNVDRILLPALFKINKEESLVFDDRSADCEPVLVTQVIRLRSRIEV